MQRRTHTLAENLVSAAIGVALGVLVIGAAQKERTSRPVPVYESVQDAGQIKEVVNLRY